jgi:NADPH:quinone reductase-like Zn-dependent oxidoreductase
MNTVKFKSVVATGRGSSEVLKIMENELREPSAGEARIKILAVAVCQDDIAVRVGKRPFLPKVPFTPGYNIVGDVDAIGEGVTEVAVGDRVAALTVFGGYAEYIYLAPDKLVQVPRDLHPAEVAPLILNYLVAYQVLHRMAKVKPGDKVLLIGASGGVGTAFLDLGKLDNLKMYGLASPGKHAALIELGAIPIDYRSQDFVAVLHHLEPNGLDAVFNGMAEDYLMRGMAVLRRGGTLVHYGGPESLSRFLLFMAEFIWLNVVPDGKSILGYGTHRVDLHLLKEDWHQLFTLLAEGKIKPIIAAKFPILDATEANDLLASGSVVGNVILLAPELM